MQWKLKEQSSVLSVAVSECTKMESGIHVGGKCSDICVEIAIVGFQLENVLHPATSLFLYL